MPRKIICLISVLLAVSFTVYYLSLGNGLFGNEAALSKTGLNYPVQFFIWGALTYFALAFNLHTAYKKTKFKLYILLLIISLIGILLTVCCDFDYAVYPQYIAHCIGSLAFSATMGINVFTLFIIDKKYIFAAVCGVILVLDLILLLIFKETALIEITPIFAGYILLLINNLKKERVKVNAK